MAYLVGVVLLVNVVHVSAYTKVSPIDEVTHLDYMIRAAEGDLVRLDDPLAPESLREIACRGSDTMTALPSCDAPDLRPEQFIWKGWNSAGAHTPYYYVVTGVAARLLRAASPFAEIVTWARLFGSVWLLAGFYVVLRAADLLEIRRRPIVITLTIAASVPSVLHANNTVNPDASAFLSGAVVLLAAVNLDQRWSYQNAALLVIAGAVAASMDTTNVVGVLVALGYLVLRPTPGRSRLREAVVPSILVAIGTLLAAAVVYLAWGKYVSSWGEVDLSESPMELAQHVDSITGTQVFGKDTVFAMLPPVSSYIPPVLESGLLTLLYSFTSYAFLGATVGQLLLPTRFGPLSRLAASTLSAALACGPLFVLYNYANSGRYFPIPPRYGLSALPAFVIVVAGTATSTRSRVMLAFLAFSLVAGTVAVLIW